MVRKTTTATLDDLDGREGAQEVNFALDGVTYAIDLHPDNYAGLVKTLTEFIEKGRRVAGKAKSNGHRVVLRPRPTADSDTRIIRQWWREQGTVAGAGFSERGRIPRAVEAAFRQNGGSTSAPEAEVVPEAAPVARSTRSKPVPADLAQVYQQVGTKKGVADYYGVSYPTASRWVSTL